MKGRQILSEHEPLPATETASRACGDGFSHLAARLGPGVLQRKLAQRALQRRSDGQGAADTATPQVSGAGHSLPAATQAKMERAFGADFSSVNVHADSPAATSVDALAFTQGNDVHFAPGHYHPGSAAGDELIGHELAHVQQQGAGRVAAGQGKEASAINSDAGLEAEADAAGAAAARGEPAVVAGTGTGRQREADPAAPLQLKSWKDRLKRAQRQTPDEIREEVVALLAGMPRAQRKRLSKMLSLGKRTKHGKKETARRDAVRKALLVEITRQAQASGGDLAGVDPEEIANLKEQLLQADVDTIEAVVLTSVGAEGGDEVVPQQAPQQVPQQAPEDAPQPHHPVVEDDEDSLIKHDEHGEYLDPRVASRAGGIEVGERRLEEFIRLDTVEGRPLDENILDVAQLGPPFCNDPAIRLPGQQPRIGNGMNGVAQFVTLRDGSRAVAKRTFFSPYDTKNMGAQWMSLRSLMKEAAIASSLGQIQDPGTGHLVRYITAGHITSQIPLMNETGQFVDRRGTVTDAMVTFPAQEAVVVFALAAGGDLEHRLMQGPLTPAHAERMLGQLARALTTLARFGMTHADVAPKNVFLHNDDVVLGDLGEVTDHRGEQGIGYGQGEGGTMSYHAGKDGTAAKTQAEKSSGKMDVWSMGLTVLDMLAGLGTNEEGKATNLAGDRFSDLEDQGVIDQAVTAEFGRARALFAGNPEDAAALDRLEALVRRMLVYDPAQRADAGAIAAAAQGLQGLLQHHAVQQQGGLEHNQ